MNVDMNSQANEAISTSKVFPVICLSLCSFLGCANRDELGTGLGDTQDGLVLAVDAVEALHPSYVSGGLLSSGGETVKLGTDIKVTVEAENGERKIITLYDLETWTTPRYEFDHYPYHTDGSENINSFTNRLEIGKSRLEFPTTLDNNSLFDSTGSGKLDVDSISIIDQAR